MQANRITRAILFVLVFVFSANIQAQSTDSLGLASFDGGFFHTYYNGLGSPTGNNAYLDQVKAQQFNPQSGVFVFHGAMVRLAGLIDADSTDTSTVKFQLCAMNGSGTGSNNTRIAAPGTVWQEVEMNLSQLDTGIWINIPFAMHTAAEPFAILMEMSGLQPGDSISLYHSKVDNTAADDLSWERRSDGTWKTLRFSWPLDVDLAIVALVEQATGLDEGVKKEEILFHRRQDFVQWRNPTSEASNLMIYDLQGRFLMSEHLRGAEGSLHLNEVHANRPLLFRLPGRSFILLP